MTRKLFLIVMVWLCGMSQMAAQDFYNLTASEVRIDSLLPQFNYTRELGRHYADSIYEVSIDYPEFINMSSTDVARYRAITADTLPEMPRIHQFIGVARKQGRLYVSFIPLVCRNGQMQKLVSFKLTVRAKAKTQARRAGALPTGEDQNFEDFNHSSPYTDHSVLATGQWAKIRVPETGIYQLTDAFLRQAGFTHPDRVRIYGYGGALQPEQLTADYLQETDDLQEVPTCTVGGRRLFWGVGPVNWGKPTDTVRSRNPYSTHGYYFLTEGDEEPLSVDSAQFVAAFYPSSHYYHSLHEVDDYAWFHGGRNLYQSDLFGAGVSRDYMLAGYSDSGRLTVRLTYDKAFQATISLNGTVKGSINISREEELPDKYSAAREKAWTFNVNDIKRENNVVTITQSSGGDVRLDYIAIVSNSPREMESLSTATFAVPEYVYHITNQDHHADAAVDMVIIIPTSQKLLEQAERLQQMHEQEDGLRVRIVPADELYNEFSSGTPDANAYRRYLKMLYDRAESEEDMPRYLLLMGDGAWDNRMQISSWRNTSPDDFLLCYESENSFSEVNCYVSDDYFCLLDDDEGGNMLTRDRSDVAVGRIAARTPEQAKAMVDKIISYRHNEQAGAWQNTLCFMGDDGDDNRHMKDAEAVISVVNQHFTAYNIKKIYWDAYTLAASATGHTYPDVTRLIKQQMQSGALVMNYTGHGATYTLSHEQVFGLSDFASASSMRLPLWITASCDIMPFDGTDETIGETAMLNPNGGAVAFYGTTRTVYADHNQKMNRAFMRHLLGSVNGVRTSIGEAVRLAKNDLINNIGKSGEFESDGTANKLQFTLLGDPALVLAAPTLTAQIDSINGHSISEGIQRLNAGQRATITGHIPDHDTFNGVVTVTVQDVEVTVTGKCNNPNETPDPLVFTDRPNTIYSGRDSVHNGRFQISFVVPKDISYSDDTGQLLIYAVSQDKTLEAHGVYDGFVLAGDEIPDNDGIGPSIYCYLNSSSFTNGSTVNATPFFYAELSDKDGINAAGSGIGHDLELIIDGEMRYTYNLNEYFQYEFGDYTRGNVGYSLPSLPDGPHKLLFRAWDMLNNSSTSELTFEVDSKQTPSGISVICTRNPAATHTQFVINHDRTGSQMDVVLEIFDTSGRKLWEKAESGIPTDQTYVVDWDLTIGNGQRLHTGVYLYRVLVSSNGSQQAMQAKKLIVTSNK